MRNGVAEDSCRQNFTTAHTTPPTVVTHNNSDSLVVAASVNDVSGCIMAGLPRVDIATLHLQHKHEGHDRRIRRPAYNMWGQHKVEKLMCMRNRAGNQTERSPCYLGVAPQ